VDSASRSAASDGSATLSTVLSIASSRRLDVRTASTIQRRRADGMGEAEAVVSMAATVPLSTT
jgi:hypothetical protein